MTRREQGVQAGDESTPPGDKAASAAAPETGHAAQPLVRELERAECEAILSRNIVGRLAFAFRDRVDIEPVHYVYGDGWLWGRTSSSAKLDVLRHSRWIAFEVDEIDGVFDWRSVVAHGAFYTLDPDGAPAERTALARGMELLRRIVPATGTPDDPVPHRNVLFRIHVDRLAGRASTSRAD
ncbi:MAG TPA: pyridoxamine 5'-phosphate oxidase family protein [Gemmatimonadaceae bacterium]|nr:pyridoxamine 5'-phosphate oxidase family protein [Gemmatimonadaceae bacterium]